MSFPNISFRCSKIASKLHRTIEKYTPNFKLKIDFQTIQLSSLILPRLKPQKNNTLIQTLLITFIVLA